MPGTLSLLIEARATFDGHKLPPFEPGQKQITLNTLGTHSSIVTVGTTEEVVPVGDVATEGYVLLVNLDPSNYVDWGKEVAGTIEPSIQLDPGEPHAFRLKPGVTYRWQANTAPCKVAMILYND